LKKGIEGKINAIKPHVIVFLGATAAYALLGKDFKASTQRGHFMESGFADFVFATLHPSAILRIRESEQREVAFQSLNTRSIVDSASAGR